MRDAMIVFDKWLKEEESKPPISTQERIERELEWKEYRKLCMSTANIHSYNASPSKEDLTRAADDLKCGKDCLLEVLALSQRKATVKTNSSFLTTSGIQFPLPAFTALFGGPGLHGYGKHEHDNMNTNTNTNNDSLILIDGMIGLYQLLPQNKVTTVLGGTEPKYFRLYYNRINNMARVEMEYANDRITISTLWNNMKKKKKPNSSSANSNDLSKNGLADFSSSSSSSSSDNTPNELSWTCPACTFDHIGEDKQLYLTCELCGTSRRSSTTNKESDVVPNNLTTTIPSSSQYPVATNVDTNVTTATATATALSPQISSSTAWGSLRPPSDRDIHGPRKRHKAFDAPPPLLDFLVVMDLEWTADKKMKTEPICEITQMPSVVMKLVDKKWAIAAMTTATEDIVLLPEKEKNSSPIQLPADLSVPCCFSNSTVKADAYAVSAFDTFVRPTLNPRLTQFSIDLTAITQEDVNAAPTIDIALKSYMKWLKSLDLVDGNGFRKGNWCFATWGDVDIMSTLRQELEYKSIRLPPCFDRWINLKHDSIYKKHYCREPKGGLRACVESIGTLSWEGRAHNGFIDSVNTAKIVRHMIQTGFRFTRSTRGLDRDGVPFGQKKMR
jgi:inhibitor of KinA sporulation pathway (predicted exonuclease)